jgi:hypothetical protein
MRDVGIFILILSILRPNGMYILWPFGAFCGYLVYFLPLLVCCTEKNLATLILVRLVWVRPVTGMFEPFLFLRLNVCWVTRYDVSREPKM